MFNGSRPIKKKPVAEVQPERPILTPAMLKDEREVLDLSVRRINNSGCPINMIPSSSSSFAMAGSSHMLQMSSNRREAGLNSKEEDEELDDVHESHYESANSNEPVYAEIPVYDLKSYPPNEVSIFNLYFKCFHSIISKL